MNGNAKTYEGMFLLEASTSDFEAASEPIRNVLARSEAQTLSIQPWEERRLAYEIRGHKRALYVLTFFKVDPSRIVEIDGVEKGKLTAFIDDLEMADISAMMDAFDESDGGIESTIEVECSACGELQLVELPLEREFWLPRAKKRAAQTMLDRL